MSYEVFGDGGDVEGERLLEAGWWATEQVEEVTAAVQALSDEPVYEDRQMAKGISVRFLARLTLLRHAVGLPTPDDLRREAEQMFAATDTPRSE